MWESTVCNYLGKLTSCAAEVSTLLGGGCHVTVPGSCESGISWLARLAYVTRPSGVRSSVIEWSRVRGAASDNAKNVKKFRSHS